MKKIPNIFLRSDDRSVVIPTPNPEASWVFDGEGLATRKYDGSCCRITEEDGMRTLWKRYDCKRGKKPPEGFVAAQEPDAITGHHPGWFRCDRSKPDDKYFFEGFDRNKRQQTGTYELCGPKVQGNPEGLRSHLLLLHGDDIVFGVPRDFEGLKEFLRPLGIEGIVFHHADGRMAKIRTEDFGLTRLAYLF